MKDGYGHKTGRRGLAGVLAALMLAAVMIILPSVGAFADPVDVSQPVTLTVYPSGGGNTETFSDNDINTANIVIDLYKVADARKADGYDTYEFVSNETYGTLFNKSSVSIDNKDITNAQWRQLAQQAAGIALGTAAGRQAQTPAVRGETIGTRIPTANGLNLTAGLYLVIARGSDISANEYIKTLEDGSLATIARSATYEYAFEPELVALPTKEAVNGVINTANPGDWIYNATIYLKAAREVRKSSMEIVKTLDTYETKDPASFVFRVEGTGPRTQTYSNVFSIVFDEPGTKKISIEDLPIGMEMTVTEIYSGNNYKLTSAATKTVTIAAEEVVQATFENDYDDSYHGGGSIENRFTYNEGGNNTGWTWYGIDDSGKRYELSGN